MTDTGNHNIWVKQLIEGDEAAYKIFFKEYYQIFAHFAFKYVKDIDVAEDIVHDVTNEILPVSTNSNLFSISLSKTVVSITLNTKTQNKITYKQVHSSKMKIIFWTQSSKKRSIFSCIKP